MQVTVLPDEVVSHTRWPLASFTGARDFAQEAEPSGPRAAGWAGRSASVTLGL